MRAFDARPFAGPLARVLAPFQEGHHLLRRRRGKTLIGLFEPAQLRGPGEGGVAQLKKGIVSDYLLPDVALVSPQMTLTCPRSVTAASGVDALVHAIESYLSVNASPITDALAIGAIKLIAKALPKAYANPADLLAREDMATASLMAGMAFGNAGVGAGAGAGAGGSCPVLIKIFISVGSGLPKIRQKPKKAKRGRTT